MRKSAMDAGYFEALYAERDDPWSFATSPYEQDKYRATLAALPQARYGSALEVGCSIGILTRQLAERCNKLVATEPNARALTRAREYCNGCSNVTFAQLQAPDEWPAGPFDLILLSEVVYYFTRDGVRTLVSKVRETLAPGGTVELVHWVRETDYPLSGDEAAMMFLSDSATFLKPIRQERTANYRLDVFVGLDATREDVSP